MTATVIMTTTDIKSLRQRFKKSPIYSKKFLLFDFTIL